MLRTGSLAMYLFLRSAEVQSPTTKSINLPSASSSDLSSQAVSLASRVWGSIKGAASTASSSQENGHNHHSHHHGSPLTTNRENRGVTCDRRIELICRFLEALDKKGPDGVLKEFQAVDKFFSTTASHKAFHANMTKNRYSDVPCIDDTRIRLRIGSTEYGDYIHANRVILPFICTQGPTQNTAHDFWRMVFQERAQSIVMLCRPVEEGKAKCTVYWPEKVGEVKRLPTLIITNESKDADDEFSPITFRVELNAKYDAAADGFGGDECRPLTVKLLRWTEWPDRGIPDQRSCLVPLRLLDRVRGGTCVVHCSAGIGRTGSLIAIEMALQRLRAGKPVSIADIVRELRCQRSHAIQTEMQYLYIHKVLVEAALQLGNGSLSPSTSVKPSPGCFSPPSKEALTLPPSARNIGYSFLRRCERITDKS